MKFIIGHVLIAYGLAHTVGFAIRWRSLPTSDWWGGCVKFPLSLPRRTRVV
jgi:hypothetical protein